MLVVVSKLFRFNFAYCKFKMTKCKTEQRMLSIQESSSFFTSFLYFSSSYRIKQEGSSDKICSMRYVRYVTGLELS